MAKIKLNARATIEETFKDFIISRKAKGLADMTPQSHHTPFGAVARHMDVKIDIVMLQKAEETVKETYSHINATTYSTRKVDAISAFVSSK